MWNRAGSTSQGVSFSDGSGKAAHTLKIFLALVVSPARIFTFHAKSRDFSSCLSVLIGLLQIFTLHHWIECKMWVLKFGMCTLLLWSFLYASPDWSSYHIGRCDTRFRGCKVVRVRPPQTMRLANETYSVSYFPTLLIIVLLRFPRVFNSSCFVNINLTMLGL